MQQVWPDTHLTSLENAFQAIVRRPTMLAFDCRDLPGLPDEILPLDRLRRVLTDPARPVPRTTSDAVWRELLSRDRRGEAGWRIGAAGMAVPGLKSKAGLLTRGWRGDVRDLDAELITGFFERMTTISLDVDRICGKLIDAAERAVKRSREWADESRYVRVDGAWSIPPKQSWGHPDWVLARAVAAAVIDVDECVLIGETRLGDVALQVVADKLGIGVKVAAAWRRKAEQRVHAAIASGDLEWVSVGEVARRRAVRLMMLDAS
jgi:hypothetical protein